MAKKQPCLTDRQRSGLTFLGVVIAAGIGVMVKVNSIAQPSCYHRFADRRPLGMIPNAANVLTNGAFLVVGALGLLALARYPLRVQGRWQRVAAHVYLWGLVAVTFGSGYYHWDPGDAPLVLDRIPIAIVFMALLALVIGDRIEERWVSPWLVLGLIAYGAVSAWVWLPTHDLRLYGIAQYGSIVAIVLLALGQTPARMPSWPLAAAVAAYLLAGLCERNDGAIYASTRHWVSGHSLKHLLAAVATALITVMLFDLRSRRRPATARARESAAPGSPSPP